MEFEEIEDWNMVEIWVNGQCVFKCDIRDLDYGRIAFACYNNYTCSFVSVKCANI